MQYLKDKLSFFTKTLHLNKEKRMTKTEIYIEYVYKILTWEDNTDSLKAFLLLNFLFWLFVLFELRPLGILFCTMLMFFLCDTYFEMRMIGPDDHHSDVVDDLYNGYLDFKIIVASIRKESPFAFCLLSSIFFLSLGVSANNMSGHVFMYFVLLQTFFVHFLYKILPEKYVIAFRNMILSFGNLKGPLAEDELIPYIGNKDFCNDDLDLDSLVTDKTADSASNSLASGIMPSYLDEVEDSNDIEEEQLIPHQAKPSEAIHNQGDLSSDSDSEHRAIAFDSGDFITDNSSSEENFHVEGLKLRDLTYKDVNLDTSTTGIQKVLSNLSVVSSFITGAITSSVKSPPPNGNDSSDSEFEIINSTEI